jgi:large subunit ribosomal protein L4
VNKMTEITVLNDKFESSGKLATEIALAPEVISESAVHQVVKATLANRRQGNACTKNRAATNGGGAKPFKQKGTGRARQGSSRSPLMVGGGVAFGPTPRDFSQKLNKRMVLRALQSVVADKLQAGKLTVVEELKSNGKTKEMFNMLDSRGLLPALVVTKDGQSPALRAVRNLRNAKGMGVEGFSVYESVKFENLVIEKAALETLLSRMV